MPFLNSYADVIRDWESLLSSCKKNAELLSGMDPVIAPWDQVLLKMKDLKSQQEQLEGVRKATTQQLQQLREEGYEAARRPSVLIRAASTNGNRGGKLPTGNAALRSPAFSLSAASRKAARNQNPLIEGLPVGGAVTVVDRIGPLDHPG